MDADHLASWLLEQEPHVALRWVGEMLAGTRPVPDHFNWLGLAECAASKACSRPRNAFSPSLDWACVAALSYQYLIQEEKNSSHLIHKPELKRNRYLSYRLNLMRVRARAILTFGPEADDFVRDVDHLIQDFLEEISFSPEELLEAYQRKDKERSFRERMEIHWLQQKCQVLYPLQQKHLLPPDQRLIPWLTIWDHIRTAHQ